MTELDPHPDASDPEPFAGPDHPIRQITRRMAFGDEWRPDHAERMASLFDEMAPEWGSQRPEAIKRAPVEDAIDRGELPLTGEWLELGSGTGAGSTVLAPRVRSLVATDLSAGMLAHAPDIAPRVRGDASKLPYDADTFDGILLVNMLLFPGEVDRVLRPDGAIVWINTLGDQTPIHLPAADVLEALPGEWGGVTARAGTGFWLVARRR